MRRRSFLKAIVWGSATLCARGRVARADPAGPSALWVHLQATGGWDQALFCDPKPAVRPALSGGDAQVRAAGRIPYLGFADFGMASGFFSRMSDRLLVINGVDTATNNHDVGARYSSTGSSNEGHPCLAAQIAAVYGQTQPLAFLDYGGYDQTGDLIAPTRVQLGQTRQLQALIAPNSDGGGGTFVPPGAQALVEAAHEQRLGRLAAGVTLPGAAQGLARLRAVRTAQKQLSRLTIPGGSDTPQKLVDIGLLGFQTGLSASMSLSVPGFDTHSDNDSGQRGGLQAVFTLAEYIINAAELRGVPVVLVMTSDFGRTPYYTGSGTDHWPVSSLLVLLSRDAKGKIALPTGAVIGATTDGGADKGLRPRKVNPRTLELDPAGITLTPGHLYRALRRVAGVAGAEALRRFPISVDQDLALG